MRSYLKSDLALSGVSGRAPENKQSAALFLTIVTPDGFKICNLKQGVYSTHRQFRQLRLMALEADGHARCSQPIRGRQPFLTCASCRQFFHCKCLSIQAEESVVLMESGTSKYKSV